MEDNLNKIRQIKVQGNLGVNFTTSRLFEVVLFKLPFSGIEFSLNQSNFLLYHSVLRKENAGYTRITVSNELPDNISKTCFNTK